MKRVEHSGHILIKAVSTGEPDGCDFAIIHVTKEWQARLQRRLEVITLLKEEKRIYYLSYWEGPEGFYKNPEDETLWASQLLQGDTWCFIEFSPNETENLESPENVEALCQLRVYTDGKANYNAYSKNENSEFITDDFTITDVLKINA